MPYDEYIKRGDPPVYPIDPSTQPLMPEDVVAKIVKAIMKPDKTTTKRYSAVSKGSRKR